MDLHHGNTALTERSLAHSTQHMAAAILGTDQYRIQHHLTGALFNICQSAVAPLQPLSTTVGQARWNSLIQKTKQVYKRRWLLNITLGYSRIGMINKSMCFSGIDIHVYVYVCMHMCMYVSMYV